MYVSPHISISINSIKSKSIVKNGGAIKRKLTIVYLPDSTASKSAVFHDRVSFSTFLKETVLSDEWSEGEGRGVESLESSKEREGEYVFL